MIIEYDQTCGACPEQYDAYYNNEVVGYLRLRHGRFTVECPDCGGELVLEASPKGDGCFDDDEEKDYYLTLAAKNIESWLIREGKLLPEANYVITNKDRYKSDYY